MSVTYPIALLLLLPLLFVYKRSKKISLLFVSIILMIIALMDIRYKTTLKENLDAKEYIVAIDMSRSMVADDVKPNRVLKAKELIKKMLDKNPNDLFSLFAFTTNALILSPPSSDHKLIKNALDAIDIKNILTKGTDILSLLKRVSKLKSDKKTLIIFSDGGDDIELEKTLEFAKKQHITISAVGVGTKDGAMLKDEFNRPIRDKNNHFIISRLNNSLEVLAKKSGGFYEDFNSFDGTIKSSSDKVDIKKLRYKDIRVFWIPLLFAVILFLLHFIKIQKKIVLLLPFLSNSVDASMIFDWYHIKEAKKAYKSKDYKKAVDEFSKIDHKTLQSILNLANSYYQMGKYKEALSIYSSLKSSDPRYKKIILFKKANTLSHLKRYKEAKNAYIKALSFGKDEDILYNLRLILFKEETKRKRPAVKSKEQNNKNSATAKNDTKKSSSKKNSSNQEGSKSSSSGKNSDTKSISKNGSISKHPNHPMSYKEYDKINKGYIYEKKPW